MDERCSSGGDPVEYGGEIVNEALPPEWLNLDPGSGELEPLSPGTEAPAEELEPVLYYPSVEVFFREKFRYSYQRAVGPQAEFRWAATWWEHAEAISRLEAVWRSWEHLRQDPALGMSTWWLNHADPHMHALLSPNGPFGRSEDMADLTDPLPHAAAPRGMFLLEPSIWRPTVIPAPPGSRE